MPINAGLGFPVVKKSKLFFKSKEIPPQGLPPLKFLFFGWISIELIILPSIREIILIFWSSTVATTTLFSQITGAALTIPVLIKPLFPKFVLSLPDL